MKRVYLWQVRCAKTLLTLFFRSSNSNELCQVLVILTFYSLSLDRVRVTQFAICSFEMRSYVSQGRLYPPSYHSLDPLLTSFATMDLLVVAHFYYLHQESVVMDVLETFSSSILTLLPCFCKLQHRESSKLALSTSC